VSLTFVTSNGFEVKTRYLNMCIYNKTQNESKLFALFNTRLKYCH